MAVWMPAVLVYWGPSPPNERRTEIGSPGWQLLQQVNESLFEADLIARRKPLRNGRAIRSALDGLQAKFGGASFRAADGVVIQYREMLEINTGNLVEALFGAKGKAVGEEMMR